MRRSFLSVQNNGESVFWLGVNFWSRRGGPQMWAHYDGETVSEELAVLQAHGLNMTRSFLYWPHAQPAPDMLDESVMERFSDFLGRHSELGLTTVPTFIVGHMSGENWDPSWRRDRDLYADVSFVAQQAWYVREVVKRFAEHPAISGWLLSNEMPIYGRPPHLAQPPAPREQVTAWAQLLTDAVRAGGGRQPVSTGDGAWGPEMSGVDNGFSVRDLLPSLDFLGPHVYRMETDPVRQNFSAAFVCDLAAFADRPIVLEEFGATTQFGSDENVGHYYRQTLHNSLLAGATGWIAWNNTDYDDLYEQAPYSHHVFELHFGVTDSQGRPKSALLELAAFRATLDAIDVTSCRRPDAAAALVVPSYIDAGYPFTVEQDHTAPIASLRQAYIAAREADLAVGFVREADGLPEDVSLFIVPSLKQLTGPTWRTLMERARAGATVYVSYFSGDHPVQRGPWYGDIQAMFGVRHELRYGLASRIEGDEVTVVFGKDFGSITEGTMLRVPIGGGVEARSFLPVTAVDATVVASDAAGRPVLVQRELGAGRIVLCTYPLEYMAACLPAVNPEPTYRIYDALAVIAGIERDVVVDDPRVCVGELTHSDGRRFIWLVSQSPEALTATPRLRPGLQLRTLDGAATAADQDLPPYGVLVLGLEGAD